MVVSKPF